MPGPGPRSRTRWSARTPHPETLGVAPRDPARLTDGRTETPEKPALAPPRRRGRKANGALLPLRGALTSGASFLALLGSAFSQQAGQNEEAFQSAHLAPDTALSTQERTRVPRAECPVVSPTSQQSRVTEGAGRGTTEGMSPLQPALCTLLGPVSCPFQGKPSHTCLLSPPGPRTPVLHLYLDLRIFGGQ